MKDSTTDPMALEALAQSMRVMMSALRQTPGGMATFGRLMMDKPELVTALVACEKLMENQP